MNPLLLPVVLEKLFDQCNWAFSDLQNFRLTCKAWNDVLRSQWRSTATLCLRPKNFIGLSLETKFDLERRKRYNGMIINDFVKSLNDARDPLQLRSKPFHKYKLIGWNIDGTDFGFKNSWNTFGDLIECLTFDTCNIHDFAAKLFKHMVYDKSPNLRHLILHRCYFFAAKKGSDLDYDSDESGASVEPVETRNLELFKLLKKARHPNVKVLEVNKWMPFEESEVGGDDYYGYDVFIETFPNLEELKMVELAHENVANEAVNTVSSELALENVNANNVLLLWAKEKEENPGAPTLHPSIKSLDIMHWNLSPDAFAHNLKPLIDLKLPLQTLSLCGDLNHAMMLNAMINIHKKTLKILKVFVPPFMEIDKYMCFWEPLLIEELEFWGNIYEDFSFLVDMPQLKKLRMDFGCFEKWDYMRQSYLTKAIYPVDSTQFLSNTLAGGCRGQEMIMQNLRVDHLTEFHVDLAFGKEDIRMFAKWMPNLKCFKSIFDNDTFGVVCEEMGQLEELHALYGSDVDDSGIVGIGPSTPNITWLKELRHFTSEAYCDQGKLSDKSAENAFLQMELYTLRISVSPQFSVEMERRLKEWKCYDVLIIRNYGDHESLNYGCCSRLQFKMKALVPREEGVHKSFLPMLEKTDLVEAGSRM